MALKHGNEKFITVTPIISWAENWRNCHDSRWLLWMLECVSCSEAKSRVFACWCARQSWRIVGHVIYEDMVEMAELYSLGKAERQQMAILSERRAGGAAGAGICGMPKCRPGAAAQLTSFETCRDDAKEAAWQAALYAAMAAGYKAAEKEADRVGWKRNCEEKWQEAYRVTSFIAKYPSISKEAEDIARAEQADGLRQIVGNLMLRDDMEVPVPAQTLAYWMTWGFVPERRHPGVWHFTSDLLGVRASFNTIVAQYSPSGVVVCTPEAMTEITYRKRH